MASSSSAAFLFLLLLLSSLHPVPSSASLFNNLSSPLPGIRLPTHLSFNAVTSSADSACHLSADTDPPKTREDPREAGAVREQAPPALKLHLSHRSAREPGAEKPRKQSWAESAHRDVLRIQTLFRRITERKNLDAASRLAAATAAPVAEPPTEAPELAGRLMGVLKSGVPLGSGEYFMEVFVGTPARRFSLILDTGSDLNWLQCAPCHACFEQRGPVFDPAASSSYRAVGCGDPRCGLVSTPDPPRPCAAPSDPCPYFYWYGDHSNTTGDLALETFTVNLTGSAQFRRVDGVIFGCGHWNRGLFHGAAGLLGLGRGPLSFASQLRSLYGHSFSYCLVDRDSDASVSSKLIFGEDAQLLAHPRLNYTAFVAGEHNQADTFYYVKIKGILVGGKMLPIPPETWELSKDGAGGTIVDSGTTLSYFAEPAYQMIRDAFLREVTAYPLVEDFPVLSPCYNVSGAGRVELPEFAVAFGDGAVWNFPAENYFIRIEPEEVVCLAILGTPRASLSIIGNYQQQNFHVLYDLEKGRLGFAPMRCAEV